MESDSMVFALRVMHLSPGSALYQLTWGKSLELISLHFFTYKYRLIVPSALWSILNKGYRALSPVLGIW